LGFSHSVLHSSHFPPWAWGPLCGPSGAGPPRSSGALRGWRKVCAFSPTVEEGQRCRSSTHRLRWNGDEKSRRLQKKSALHAEMRSEAEISNVPDDVLGCVARFSIPDLAVSSLTHCTTDGAASSASNDQHQNFQARLMLARINGQPSPVHEKLRFINLHENESERFAAANRPTVSRSAGRRYIPPCARLQIRRISGEHEPNSSAL
jgi:hypothetical protein